MGRSDPQRQSTPTRGLQYTFRSGKYQGKTAKEVAENDPNYLLWLANNTDLDFDHSVIELAEETSQNWRP